MKPRQKHDESGNIHTDCAKTALDFQRHSLPRPTTVPNWRGEVAFSNLSRYGGWAFHFVTSVDIFFCSEDSVEFFPGTTLCYKKRG